MKSYQSKKSVRYCKDKDALHLASAVYGNCEYFITYDDKFVINGDGY
ncbi:conserved protein of unknown function [Tepidanaerobacter acetatoxydans Re1]|uniref:PIN domain-containing protein n=1 Tax=Tepidanaerobacter acetatoxydans (strain DSM 21804 / JCM 16047 / Re1) TaxID=1209989 RepID=F4LT87_TEPAE|nr:hypothetical protein TepRe1_2380 [Tepidanaerobacter acetatoxydans Re1]CCP27426.1 conserved protein of unknown function [Tepidanaerobacter acetatoxydans Re1]